MIQGGGGDWKHKGDLIKEVNEGTWMSDFSLPEKEDINMEKVKTRGVELELDISL